MSKSYIRISLFVLCVLLLVSCKNTQEKMQDYVNNFNSYASLLQNGIITSASADASIPENEIRIIFQTNLQQNEDTKEIYNKTLPSLIAELLKKDTSSMDLVDEGVHFKVSFLAENSSELTELIVDKKKMDELLKDSVLTPPAVASKNPNLTPQMQEILALLNKNMPIENKAEGTKIFKIDITEANELVYKIEVPNDYAALLKMDSANELIKESLIRSSDFRKVISAVSQYGITTIKYQYQNSKGTIVNTITLTQNDLK